MLRKCVVFALLAPAFSQQPAVPIRGFPPEDWKAQHDREDRAKAVPQPDRIHAYMEHIASKPHQAGSPGSKAVADYLVAQLKDWGLEVRTEEFEALMPYPTSRLLEMTSPVRFRAELKEPVIPEDPGTVQPGQLPTYNAYSASGDVTAALVYVNYGLPEDYAELKREGVDAKGKIVIARYGRSWRGVKAKLAQENGAIGCLIYSDPHEDGYYQGDVYPKGAMRPDLGVQRGSILDMAVYPGDPLSFQAGRPNPAPGGCRWRRRSRFSKSPCCRFPTVRPDPCLNSWAAPSFPKRGAGPSLITYHAGAGPAIVHLKVDFDWSTKPLHDVIVTIPGAVFPDQWIVYGNHHDAWVNGASDPASGAAVLLETARTLSVLLKQGWRPKRTIVFALWDGEEFGLMGSTEWTEKHLKQLQHSAAVYINSDNTGRGAFAAGGSSSLEAFLAEVLRDTNEPAGPRTLLDAALSGAHARIGKGPEGPEFRLAPLGSGSDYVPFLDHAGIASLNLGFAGGDAGVYHSIYDTLAWFDRFSDGDLAFGKSLTQVMSTSILRLADAPVLPFEFNSLARAAQVYVDEIQQEARKHPGALDLRAVQFQLGRLDVAAKAYEAQLALTIRQVPPLPPDKLAKANEALQKAEGALLSPEGLPGREWYQHQIYAPGLYTGYDAKTLPGIREAVEAQHYDEANQQAPPCGASLARHHQPSRRSYPPAEVIPDARRRDHSA